MKRILLFISICSSLVLSSCDERDDIRKDISSLNSRLDSLNLQVSKINDDLVTYQQLFEGIIMIKSYAQDNDGNYILQLSNGQSLTIYSGKTSALLPVMSIGNDGYWYYSMNGQIYPLLDNDGKKISATPSSGKQLQIRINSGKWEYSFDGSHWLSDIGQADPSNGSMNVSFFIKVEKIEKGLSLTWKDVNGTIHTQTVALLDDFSIKIQNIESLPLLFKSGETKTLQIVQQNIDKIVIEPTTWIVKVKDDRIILTAPLNDDIISDEENVYIKYFSKNGLSKVVVIPVKLTI